MKKNIKFSLAVMAIAFVAASCTKELKKVNENPNNLEHADPTTLLSNILVSEFYGNANIAWTLGNGYNQYMTYSQDYYNTATRYQPVTNEPYWITMYEAARDANLLYAQGKQQKNSLMQAAALTLRSYAFAQLTELWGDIPFTQALNGNTGVFTPAYDKQQTVYTDPSAGILPSLKRADSLLKATSANLLNGDLLYKGNINGWRRFINALRLRYLLRVSAKTDVSAEMQSIISDGTIMQSDGQSAAIDLPSTTPYNFPSLTERSGDFNVKYLNTTLYNAFVATSDSARIRTYFTINSSSSSSSPFSFSSYGGMPLVVNTSSTQANNASHFNSNFLSISNKGVIKARLITYAEQEFILAEAAMKGLVAGDANAFYQNGVIAAFQQVGLSTAQSASYLTNPNVVLNTSNAATELSQIVTQKWIANINNGFEGWIEYKRTGYPMLDAGGSASLNNGTIPNRFLYPNTESTINSTNYKAELQTMGGKETTNYKAWW